MERKEGMTPSFFYRDREEQLLFALAPQRVLTALRAQPEETWALLHGSSPPDPEKKLWATRILQSWNKHLQRCHPENVFHQCEREKIEIVFPTDSRWPIQLNHLDTHTPQLLFLRGTLPTIPHIAVIGSRSPTAYGERVTEHIIANLAQTSVSIISGLALGTDGRAHEAAIKHGLPTLAVLGTGISDQSIYPSNHTHLAREIIRHGGGLISEVPPGAEIHAGSFPARNRIISALCQALIVVEAREKSGTLITARIALELGRDILAVPGSIFSEASVGTHALLAAGARLYTKTEDIWSALKVDAPTSMKETRTGIQLSVEDRRIVDTLKAHEEGLSSDALNATLELEGSAMISRLGLLELQGVVRQGFGGNWVVN